MEPIKIKKISKTVPFGFKESSTPGYLEPVREELEALDKAKDYLKNCSLRETASWLHRKTGRYISHVGLKKRIERSNTSETKESNSKESQEVNTTDSSSQS
jgi:hypothetical protein